MEFTLKKQEMIMVVTILLGAFIAALSQSLLTNAIPTIMSEINITASWAQWMTSAYGLTIGIVAITTPYLISKYDVRKLLWFVWVFSWLGVWCLILHLIFLFCF